MTILIRIEKKKKKGPSTIYESWTITKPDSFRIVESFEERRCFLSEFFRRVKSLGSFSGVLSSSNLSFLFPILFLDPEFFPAFLFLQKFTIIFPMIKNAKSPLYTIFPMRAPINTSPTVCAWSTVNSRLFPLFIEKTKIRIDMMKMNTSLIKVFHHWDLSLKILFPKR